MGGKQLKGFVRRLHLWLVHLSLLDAHSTGGAAAHAAGIWQQQAPVLRLPQHIPAWHTILIIHQFEPKDIADMSDRASTRAWWIRLCSNIKANKCTNSSSIPWPMSTNDNNAYMHTLRVTGAGSSVLPLARERGVGLTCLLARLPPQPGLRGGCEWSRGAASPHRPRAPHRSGTLQRPPYARCVPPEPHHQKQD